MNGLEIIDRSNREQTAGYAVKEAAAMYGMLVLVFAAYFSVFEVHNPIAALFLLPLPAAGIAVWAGRWGRRKWIPILTVAASAMLVLTPWNFLNGISVLANAYIRLNNEFYGVSQPLLKVNEISADILAALFGIQIILALLLQLAGKCKHGARGNVLVLLVIVLPVAMAATVGKMPSTAASWCLLGGTLFYMRWKICKCVPLREAAGILMMLGVLFGCTQACMPYIRTYKLEHEDRLIEIYDRLTQMQQIDMQGILEARFGKEGSYSGGGIGKGNLEHLSEFKPTGEKALEVIVTEKPRETLYLRAYTGVNYTGRAWEKETVLAFRQGVPSIFGESGRRALMNEPFTRISDGAAGLEQQKIRIRREGASSDFSYIPYFAKVNQDGKIYLDAWVKGRWTKDQEYSYFSAAEVKNISSGELAKESDIWNEYRTFVKEEYSTAPDGLNQLKALTRSMDQGNVEQVSNEINRLFEDTLGLRYSKTPGEVPEGEEFTEYFLTENRKGFCVHFASASALIYRMCGYSSRFVEGYAVPSNEFVRLDDGTYRAVVTDDMAHAWCETFDEKTGWVVREHTPSYMEETDAAGTPDDREDETPDIVEHEEADHTAQAEEEDLTTQPETEENKGGNVADQKTDDGGKTDNGERENKPGIIQTIGKITAVVAATTLGVIILVLCIFMVFGGLVRQKRYAGFRRRKENRGIANLYQAVYEICLFDGMEPDQQDERMTLERMKAHFSQLSGEEWEWMYLCAERAAFSGEQIDKEEQKQMFRLYQKFRRAYLKTLNRKKKFWFLYGKGL